MKVDAWMPFYIGDYLRDTMHLTTLQHGAYILLICHYWTHGPINDNDGELAAITKMTPAQWQEARPTLAKLFQVAEGIWHHRRADRELAKANRRYDGRCRSARAANATRTQHARSTHATGAQPQPQPQPEITTDLLGEPVEKEKRFKAPTLDQVKLQAAQIGLDAKQAEMFWNFYESKGWKVGKETMRQWPRALTNWKLRHDNETRPFNSRPSVDRNKGTLNESSGNDYDIGSRL